MGLAYPLQFRADAFQDVGSQDTSIRGRGTTQGDATAAPPPPTTTTTGTQQPAPTGQPGTPCGTQQILMMVGMIAIFYFLLIRPQQKQEKARRALIAALKKGDRVVTSSGLHGVVAGIADDTVQLRVDSDGQLKLIFDRSAIARVVSNDQKAGEVAKA